MCGYKQAPGHGALEVEGFGTLGPIPNEQTRRSFDWGED